MTATAEELKELAVLARDAGDEDLELQVLEQLDALSQPAPQQPEETQETTIGDIGEGALALGGEAIAGFNRGVVGLLDFLTIDQINDIRGMMGDEAIPTLSEALVGPKGQFSKGTIAEGLPTDIVGGAGEFAVNAMTGQGLIKQAAKQLAPQALSTGARVLRQAAQPSLASSAAFGGASGAGEATGRELGGEAGALVGAVAAPLTGVAALGGVKAAVTKLASKFGKNIGLIDQNTALPTPAFQKALDKRGVQYGSIIDDVDNLPALQGRQNADDVVNAIIKRKLINRSTDDVTATLRLEGNSIVADSLGEEAVKQGFKAGNVAAVKGMNSSTKKEALKMLNMNRQILANASKADDFRPTDVVGNNVLERFSFIRGRADTLRLELDNIANKGIADRTLGGPGVVPGLKGQRINTSTVEDNLVNEFRRLGVNIPDDTVNIASTLSAKGAFTGSQISKDPTSQKIIKDVVDLLGEGGSDALRAHNLKRQLDRMIDFNKKSAAGLTDAGRDFAKSIRHSLNQAIRDVSPRYAKVNDQLSMSIESMNEFQRTLGGSIDVFKKGAAKAVGQDLRGLLSNRKTRIKLENSINSLDDTARELGGSFDVNVKNLTRFANILDDRFGAVAETSLKGEVESAIREGTRATVIKNVAAKAEWLRGINDKNALNALQRILKRK